jgi:hypothetical protein
MVCFRCITGNTLGDNDDDDDDNDDYVNNNDIKVDLQEVGWGTWTESVWLRIGTGGGHL